MLGGRRLAEIDIEDLAEWQDGLEDAGVGAPTAIKAISILSSVFREAARRPRSTGVAGNPVALLEKPSAKRRRRPLVWGPVVVERVRHELLVGSRRGGPDAVLAPRRDALLVALTAYTGCRPGEALALRWGAAGTRIAISRRLSGGEIVEGTKGGRDRTVPVLTPQGADLADLREIGGDHADDYLFRTSTGRHWIEADWRNYRRRHFTRALRRVEAGWEEPSRDHRDPSCWEAGKASPAKRRER